MIAEIETALQRHLAEFTNSDGSLIVDEENEEVLKVADVNHDGIISIADITTIQRYLAEFIDRRKKHTQHTLLNYVEEKRAIA